LGAIIGVVFLFNKSAAPIVQNNGPHNAMSLTGSFWPVLALVGLSFFENVKGRLPPRYMKLTHDLLTSILHLQGRRC